MGCSVLKVTGQLFLFLMLIMDSESSSSLVPQIPDDVTLGVVSIYNIWDHALRQQNDANGQPIVRNDVDIKTFLSPESGMVVNLAPMDGPHPLFNNYYTALRTEFLLDYMIQDAVLPNDERMSLPGGLTVTNLNGKPLTFKKDADGKITIEGVEVVKTDKLASGKVVYNIANFVFDHRQRVQTALEEVRKKSSNRVPFRKPVGQPPRPCQ